MPDGSPAKIPLTGVPEAEVWARVIPQARDALVVVDLELRITACNQAARDVCAELFGVQIERGESVLEIAAEPQVRERIVRYWRRALAGEEFVAAYEIGEGSQHALREWLFQPLRAPDGTVAGGFCVMRAVTAHERVKRELGTLNEALEQQVAERTSQLAQVVAELERRKAESDLQRERLRGVLDALPVGVWIADADGKLIARNHAAREIWGEGAPMSERPEDYGEDYRGWWPDGRELTSEDWAMARAVRYGEVAERQEIEIEGRDGKRKVVLNYAQPIRDRAGEIVGAVAVNVDITDRRKSELALRASEHQYRHLAAEMLETDRTIRRHLAEIEAIYEAAPVGLVVFDRELRFVRLNETMAQISGLAREAHLGRTMREVLPWVAPLVEPYLQRVLATGEPVQGVELYGESSAPPGVTRCWFARYHPLWSGGQVIGVNATVEEITDRKRAESARQFLGEASAVLASSIDYQTTLAEAARLAIPFLADYCVVDILNDDGVAVRVTGAHGDPAMQGALEVVLRTSSSELRKGLVRRVMDTGVPEVVAEVNPGIMRRDASGDDEFLEAVRVLGPRSYMCVPMLAGGRIMGSILLVYSASGRNYGPEELEIAQELGRRAGAAVFNARQYATAEAAMHEAEAASRSKSQFLATMSHELRTPLTGIIGYTELLDEEVTGPLTARQKHQLGRIKASAWHLVTIIDEILLFARMEAGREQVRLANFDLNQLVQESVGILEPQAHAKGIALAASLPDEAVPAQSDPGKLRQVLLNLVGNALKFTDEGFVTVELTSEGGSACIRVVDTGPGVPTAELQRIFEPFTQVDGSNTRTKGGTGLGLTVSRQLAVLLGGSLELESTSSEGSSFLLTIPLRTGDPRT